jgi:hypothetical protein
MAEEVEATILAMDPLLVEVAVPTNLLEITEVGINSQKEEEATYAEVVVAIAIIMNHTDSTIESIL